MDLSIRLSLDDVTLLIEALDAYEYWELGDSLPRNNGAVFIPGDLRPEDDRYWGLSPSPDDAEVEASTGSELAGTSPTGWRPCGTSRRNIVHLHQ